MSYVFEVTLPNGFVVKGKCDGTIGEAVDTAKDKARAVGASGECELVVKGPAVEMTTKEEL